MKEDTQRALKDWCLRACTHVWVCVCVFMWVSRWTGRAYFLREKPIGCAQNEVLNRMLSSSGEVRAVCSSGCCSSARGCAESSVYSPELRWAAARSTSRSYLSPWWIGEGETLTQHWELTPGNHLWPDILRVVVEMCQELWSSLRPKLNYDVLGFSILSEPTAFSLVILQSFLPNFSVSSWVQCWGSHVFSSRNRL